LNFRTIQNPEKITTGVEMNILVRNLSRLVTEKELMQLFRTFGRIRSLNIVNDKVTGKSKGFGFVDMPKDSEAAAAIQALDGKLVQGQKVKVKTADQNFSSVRDKPDRERAASGEARQITNAGKGKKDGLPGKRRTSNR
jgi:RNA recognition motif-containing protein